MSLQAMKTLIITGGIGTGKSAFTAAWCEGVANSAVFSADAEVTRLFEQEAVVDWIKSNISSDCVDADGGVRRERLRELVFSDERLRNSLEEYLHPKVRAKCLENHGQLREQGQVEWLLLEIPLFYETGAVAPVEVDAVVVVACSAAVRDVRLRDRNGFDNTLIQSIVESQKGIEGKMAAADHVVWNDGALPVLQRQASALGRLLAQTDAPTDP